MTVDAVSALDLSYTPLLGSPWTRSSPGTGADPKRTLWLGSSGLLSLHQENTTITTCAAVSMDLHSAWPPYGTDEDT